MAAQTDLEKLIERCVSAMTSLEKALDVNNFRAGQRFLSQAEILRDALESKVSPQDFHKAADFLETKGRLDDAIVNASMVLDGMDDHRYTSASEGGLFGKSSYDKHPGNDYVNDLNLNFN